MILLCSHGGDHYARVTVLLPSTLLHPLMPLQGGMTDYPAGELGRGNWDKGCGPLLSLLFEFGGGGVLW